MPSHKQIAINTLTSYLQGMVSLGLGLFTSRWVLNALGEDDFGLYAIVGGLAGFISIVNVSMTASISRYLSYSIGQSLREQKPGETSFSTKEWFNTAICINLFLPAFFGALLLPIGEWYIRMHLNADAAMIPTCCWVFRFSVLSTFFAVLSSPFLAMYTAKQYIFVRNAFNIVQTVLLAAEGYILFSIPHDRLFYHSLLVTLVFIFTNGLLVIIALLQFKECRIKVSYWRDKTRIKELTSFCGFTMMATFGYLLNGTGTAILVNHFAGARANAGIGIGNQVSTKTSFLSSSLANAITPEITTRLGSGNSRTAIELGTRCSFYNLIAKAFFIFPLMVYIDEILKLWLKTPPLWAPQFCIIFMASIYLLSFASGQGMLVTANGRIAAFEVFQSLSAIAGVVVVGALYLLCKSTVMSVGAGMLLSYSLQAATSVYFAHRLLNVSVRNWGSKVVIPGGVMTAAALGSSFAARRALPDHPLSILAASAINAVVVIAAVLLLLDSNERRFATWAFKKICGKMFGKMVKQR